MKSIVKLIESILKTVDKHATPAYKHIYVKDGVLHVTDKRRALIVPVEQVAKGVKDGWYRLVKDVLVAVEADESWRAPDFRRIIPSLAVCMIEGAEVPELSTKSKNLALSLPPYPDALWSLGWHIDTPSIAVPFLPPSDLRYDVYWVPFEPRKYPVQFRVPGIGLNYIVMPIDPPNKEFKATTQSCLATTYTQEGIDAMAQKLSDREEKTHDH